MASIYESGGGAGHNPAHNRTLLIFSTLQKLNMRPRLNSWQWDGKTDDIRNTLSLYNYEVSILSEKE